jgi:hypothetical protein
LRGREEEHVDEQLRQPPQAPLMDKEADNVFEQAKSMDALLLEC